MHVGGERVAATAEGGVTRGLVDSTAGDTSWSAIGVSENIVETSWQALSDSIVFGLLRSVGAVGSVGADSGDGAA